MDVIEPFLDIFPPMIVCHFILSLRQVEPAGSSWASGNQSRSIRFIGNIGQSLQFGKEGEAGGEDMPGVEVASAEADVSESLEIATGAVDGEEANEGQLRQRNGTDVEAQQSTAYFDPRA
ncbi:hypothetical protein BC629DRAFT_1595824 [Irpex lacteus]|nr:hypothetical protein BC629DRAFT_1595824 [Irpex lacteus]